MLEESNARNLDQQIQLGKPKVLKGHTNVVMSVFVKDNLIISGSLDNTIRIWDIDSGICLKTLKCHRDTVRSVFVKDNLIISGSSDKTIRVTPISQFPGELPIFRSVMDFYYLAPHLEREILDYFGGE